MGLFSRKKEEKHSFSYHSRSAQADAARHLCDLLNEQRMHMPSKAIERGPGYRFQYYDPNGFEHSLCIDESNKVVPAADTQGGGGHRGGHVPGMRGPHERRMMAIQNDLPEEEQMMPAHVRRQIEQHLAWDKKVADRMADRHRWEVEHGVHGARPPAERQQLELGHGRPRAQPPVQLQHVEARDSNRPPFQNPFKPALPLGSYGKREYVPGQERIKVSDFGERADNPGTGWDLMHTLDRLRKKNERG